MPRPHDRQGNEALAAAEPPSTFEELLERLRGEHERLRDFAGSLATENHALRKRLEICGEDAGAAECPGVPAAGPPPAACLASHWRRQQPHDAGSAAALPRAPWSQELAAEATAAPAAACGGQPERGRTKTRDFVAATASSRQGTMPLHRTEDHERKVAACAQKLQNMLELPEMRMDAGCVDVLAYFEREGLDSEQALAALPEVFGRLVDYQGRMGVASMQSQLSLHLFAPQGTGSIGEAPSLRQGMPALHSSEGSREDQVSGQVQLKTLAEMLLAEDIQEFIGEVEQDVEDVIQVLRERTFQQDLEGVLPTAREVSKFLREQMESRFDQRLDMFMNVVIAANAVCMGVFAGARNEEWGVAQWVDFVFTLLFLLEAIIKLYRAGVRRYFCGPESAWNIFDTLIVALGVSDILMTALMASKEGGFDTSSLMALRLLRLGRLLRFMKLSVFRELQLMVRGIMGLMKTLGSAMILLLTSNYFLATIMVQIYGSPEPGEEGVHGQDGLFSTVPRSMFTVFRCLNLGDCNAANGTPIALQLQEASGWPFVLAHCVLFLLMNYGLGSLITALVVDTTLNEAKKVEFMTKQKESHRARTSWCLHCLERILEEAQEEDARLEGQLVPQGPTMLFLSKRSFQSVLKRPEVGALFDELDIDTADRMDLFDAIDADGNGRIELDELVGGLMRMAGTAKKSDTVAARLKIDVLARRCTVANTQLVDAQRLILERLDSLCRVVGQPWERSLA